MAQIKVLNNILVRDLKTLKRQMRAYSDEQALWSTPKGIKNSAGNLAMHLTGNLRYFIGSILGKSGYERNREFEFQGRDVPRVDILKNIDSAIKEIQTTFSNMSDDDLFSPFPIKVGGHQFSNYEFLTHLLAHFGYHLGQIDYHRRLITRNSETVDAVSVGEIRKQAE